MKTLFRFSGLLIVLMLSTDIAFSQKFELKGAIIDASSKETLPAANISIEGTYSGTITNSDGRFVLPVRSFPVTLVIRYIGYETQKITLKTMPNESLEIQMKPVSYELENVDVTGEDPAVYIMRQVIAKKMEWRKLLKTYRAEAYTRQRLNNDTGIVSINESISTAYWHFENGAREVIKSKRQTNNMTAANNFAGASYVPNFYNDDIEISGFKMMGVTHPDAIDTYAFKLEKYRMLDDKVVFDISVKPKSKLATAFKGTISVLDEDYALLEVDLVPNESMLFPPPIKEFNLYYKQQFNNFGGDFWLPVDVRIDGTISIAMMGLKIPKISFNQVSKLSEYEVNIPLPDSLYGYKRLFIVDSLSLVKNPDSLFAKRADIIPLSTKESQAYNEIDSTMTLEKAFKPTGFLAKMMEDDDDKDKKGSNSAFDKVFDYFFPEVWYNRAEGAHFGGDLHYTHQNVTAGVRGGYKTDYKGWGYGSYVEYKGNFKGNIEAKLFFNDDAVTRFSSPQYNRIFSSATFLFSGKDYFDYYWSKQYGFNASYEFRLNNPRRRRDRIEMKVGLGYLSDESRSLTKMTDYDIFATKKLERINPAVFNGKINSVKSFIQIGDDFIPFSPIGQSRAKFSIEHANSSLLGSDVDFTTYQIEIDYRIKTFFQRRFLPNALDVRLAAGTSTGDLPIQRLMTLDGTIGGFSPFGTFKSLPTTFYQGDKYVAFFWEHNFRTVPFELLGLTSLAEKGTSIIVFGSHGKTWLDNATSTALFPYAHVINGVHHELGASISGIFDFLRLDFIQRIDRPNFYIGLSVARIL
ncbi:carboxypeptidase-like regulatory domain-containing protein [bacterium]|nr:MAG: carboxypeptidase-like regulatory domain-containing protein [bacterium]